MEDAAAAPCSFKDTDDQSDHSTSEFICDLHARISCWANKLLRAWDRVCLLSGYVGFAELGILVGENIGLVSGNSGAQQIKLPADRHA